MAKLVIAFFLILGSGCGSLSDVPAVSHEAAEKLEQALDFADQSIGPAKLSALMICNTYGETSEPCSKLSATIVDTEEKLSVARDAVEAYKHAQGSFEDAHQAADEALSAIEDLSADISKLAR